MTPEEASNLANDLDSNRADDIKKFLRGASARDIQMFIHRIQLGARTDYFHFARASLDVRLAEDADRTALRLEKHTKHLLFLTYVLATFTAGLLLLTYVLVEHP